MRRTAGLLVCLIVSAVCRESVATSPTEVVTPTSTASTKFDAANCGTISGRVRWTGAIPDVPPIELERLNIPANTGVQHYTRPNPHTPNIDSTTQGVGGVVVFLRGIDPEKARPWDHPPVTVILHDEQAIVRNGEAQPGLVGIVRKGDAVTFVSSQKMPHNVRVRGSAFFTLTLPEPDKLRRRTFNEAGRIEVSSANGHLAIRGHLFVDDQPYYAITNPQGQFSMPLVPAGNYELVCWRPDWRIDRRERDPESLTYVRLNFVPPKENSLPVTIRPGETATVVTEIGTE
jgi:hypothetical protein